jgi:hypothetical protein
MDRLRREKPFRYKVSKEALVQDLGMIILFGTISVYLFVAKILNVAPEKLVKIE